MRRWPPWVISIAAAAVFLAPLIWMLLASLRTEATIFQHGLRGWWHGDGWTWRHYPDAWRRAEFGQGLVNSLLQLTAVCSVGLLVNAMAAFALARLEFPGKRWLFALILVFVILPEEALAVPLFLSTRDLGLTGSYGWAMAGLAAPFLAKAFNIYFLRQHFLTIPTELEEAAVIDGAGVWRRFWNVALPAVRPALATVAMVDVLTHWGDFLWPLMIATRNDTRTVQLSLANLFTQPPIRWGDILAGAVITTLPVVVLFRWIQRYVVPGETRAGIK